MKLGFIGAWGHAYLSKLINSDIAKVDEVGFATDGQDGPRAQQRAQSFEKLGVKVTYFDDGMKMLEQFKPDVVNVGAVYGYNGDWVATCLERDLPVVSDKPIAATWQQFERLLALTRGNQRTIVTEFPFRSDAAMRSARQAILDGRLGKVVLATGQKSYRFGDARPSWYGDRTAYGSTILWVAGHAIDFIRFVTDQPIVSVGGLHANVAKPDYPQMEDATVTTLQLANGAPGVVHADYSRPAKAASHGDDRLRVAGSLGVLEVRDGRCLICTHDQAEQDITDEVQPRSIAAEMYDAVLGKDNAWYGTAQSLEMARVLLTARDAADQQKTLPIQ